MWWTANFENWIYDDFSPEDLADDELDKKQDYNLSD